MLGQVRYEVEVSCSNFRTSPASILYKSIAGCYRPVSYPDGPITARYRFIKNAYWECGKKMRCSNFSLVQILEQVWQEVKVSEYLKYITVLTTHCYHLLEMPVGYREGNKNVK